MVTKAMSSACRFTPAAKILADGTDVGKGNTFLQSTVCNMSIKCKGAKKYGGKSSYRHVPHCQKPPHLVAKRNARERRRVEAVNNAFHKLRKHVNFESKQKRLSKVKTLRVAIDYIHKLQKMIQEHDRELEEKRMEQNRHEIRNAFFRRGVVLETPVTHSFGSNLISWKEQMPVSITIHVSFFGKIIELTCSIRVHSNSIYYNRNKCRTHHTNARFLSWWVDPEIEALDNDQISMVVRLKHNFERTVFKLTNIVSCFSICILELIQQF